MTEQEILNSLEKFEERQEVLNQYAQSVEESMPTILLTLGIYSIIVLAIAIFMLIVYWRLFKKAGEKGWKSIIPVYNSYILFKIAGMKKHFWYILGLGVVLGVVVSILSVNTFSLILAFIIPIIIFILTLQVYISLAKSFGKSGLFAIGLIVIPVIFMPILAFGKSEYIRQE